MSDTGTTLTEKDLAEESLTAESSDDGWTVPDDWRDRIAAGAGDPARVRKHLDGFADPAALAEAYAEARTAISSGRFKDKLVLPGDDADDAAWAAFLQNLPERLRPPVEPNGYEVTLPDWLGELDADSQARQDTFLAAMHAHGASRDVVQAALDTYYGMVAEAEDTALRAEEQAVQLAEADLRRDWGADYDTNVELANRFAERAFGAESDFVRRKLADGTPLGSHPDFIRMAASIGRLLGEDRLVTGDSAGDSSLQEQIDTLTSEALAAGTYHSDAVQRKLQPLYQALHGTAVADGQVA